VLDKLRILHVLDHSLPIQSGYSFRSLALLREQRRRGWTTSHLTTPKHTHSGPSPEMTDQFLFHRTPDLRPNLRNVPIVREMALIKSVARRIEEVAATERPDILHAHSPVLNALACLLASRRLHLPVVYEVRAFWEDAAVSNGTGSEGDLRYQVVRALETFAMHRSSAVAPICEGLRTDMLERGIPTDSITLIPNGVNVDEFKFGLSPDRELQTALRLDDRIVLGFIGSFYAYEGLDLLLAALAKVAAQDPKIAALLVGGGPVEAALKEQARRLHLEESVRFVGRVPHDQVEHYYDLVDIFVYPRHLSRLTHTVTPLKPLEAMARGGVVLASDVGGHRELVRDRETGYLFPAGNVDELARAILRLVADREAWQPMRKRARSFVERERTWAAAAAGYEALYTRALRTRLIH
jgi:glycogen synthase